MGQRPEEFAQQQNQPLIVYLGFALFLSWGFGCIFSFPTQFAEIAGSDSLGVGFEGMFFACFATALIISELFADRQKAFPNLALLAVSLFCTLLCGLVLLINTEALETAYLVCGFLMSLVSGYIFLCWIEQLSHQITLTTTISYAIAVAVAALIGYFVFTFEFPYTGLISLFLLFSSIIILYFANKQSVKPENISRLETHRRRPLFWKTHLTFGIFGVVFGLTLFTLQKEAIVLAVTVAVIVGAMLAIFDIWQAGGVYTDRLRRVISLTVGVGLLIVPFLSPLLSNIIWCVFACLLIYFFTVQPCWNMVASRIFKLNIISLIPRGGAHIWICIGIGWGLGYLFRVLNIEIIYLTQLILMFLIIMAVFYSPNDQADLQLLAISEDSVYDDDSPKAVEHQFHRFISSCNLVSHAYRLTPRESEVLIFLAKGRNADYICNKLVISNHTAKTHIYRIYQKIGINSQQELIDKIDEHLNV